MSTETRDLIFYIVYPIKLLLGISVFITNSFIFVIFVRKQKREPSDWLIMANLMIDALHGLGMCIPLYLFKPVVMIKGSFAFQSFIFFSLVMLILMTVNRYVAVTRPRKYRKWFEKRYIFLSFSGIASLTLALFSAVAYALFVKKVVEKSIVEYCRTQYIYRRYYHETGYVFYFDVFDYNGDILYHAGETYGFWDYEYVPKQICSLRTIENERTLLSVHFFVLYVWPQFQFCLVLINVLLMCFVYRQISKLFNLKTKFGFRNRFMKFIRQLFKDDRSSGKRRAESRRKTALLEIQETNFSSEEKWISQDQIGEALI